MCNATINSRYSFPKLAKVDLDELYGLALVIHLSKGTHLMLARNLY